MKIGSNDQHGSTFRETRCGRIASILALAAATAITTLGCASQHDASPAASSGPVSNHGKPDSLVTAEDTAAAKKLIDSYNEAPPFSFKYDGKPSSEFLNGWKREIKSANLDADRVQRTVTWKEPNGNLSVNLVSILYLDFPAIEWTAYLKNEGSGNTKKIDDLRGIDAVIGQAASTPGQEKRVNFSVGKSFPQAATGGDFEAYRGWVNAYQPMAKSAKRFDAAGHTPWISADPSDPTAVLMSPALGIEGATDNPASGKSPAIAFKAPKFGLYRISGKVTMKTNVGDGVEWDLHGDGGNILASANLDAGQSQPFEIVRSLKAGEHVFITMNSRGNIEGDIARVNFDVTDVTQPGAGEIVVHAEKGSDATESDYAPLPIGIAPEQSFSLTSAGGRGSDGMAIPYFNVEMPDMGVCVAIGWPGQWDAKFQRSGTDVRFNAGQENFHAVLMPGEEVRTPLMALVPYAGKDTQHGQNIWRRWMIAHNLPRVDGKLIGPFVAAGSSHSFSEMTRADVINQNAYIDAHLDRGIKLDYWWMDAGWYQKPTAGWEFVGTWKPDQRRFPEGFKPVSEHAHKRGVNTIVWFEPERVMPGTEIYAEHKDFLLGLPMNEADPSAGLELHQPHDEDEPNAVFNPTDKNRQAVDGPIFWKPHELTLHPGKTEYGVARFTAPADGTYQVAATFTPLDPKATTDVHVVHAGKSYLDGLLAPDGSHEQAFNGAITAKKGDTIDFAVGYGANKDFGYDSTRFFATITSADGKKWTQGDSFEKTPGQDAWKFGRYAYGDILNPPPLMIFERSRIAGEVNGGMHLLNLGNAEARKWITDRIDSIIKHDKISVYRQDFNMEPLAYWRANDKPDRQGITENMYVQGYLAYWDALRQRNPNIYIDSCASGGRRNDLETMRRATPFLRSDYCFFPIGQQSHSYGAFQWLPLNGTGVEVGDSALTPIWKFDVDPYVFRSDMASVYTLALDIMNAKYDWKRFAEYVKQYREVSPAYLGDYYPLTPSTLDPAKWCAWQFYLPTKGEGFIQAFRRDQAGEASMNLKLKGLDGQAMYDIVDVDDASNNKTVKGASLMDGGLDVAINAKPGAALLKIKKK